MGRVRKGKTREEKFLSALASFEKAVDEHAFIGTIPLYSSDNDETKAMEAERRRLITNVTRSRNRLIKLFDEQERN